MIRVAGPAISSDRAGAEPNHADLERAVLAELIEPNPQSRRVREVGDRFLALGGIEILLAVIDAAVQQQPALIAGDQRREIGHPQCAIEIAPKQMAALEIA